METNMTRETDFMVKRERNGRNENEEVRTSSGKE